MNNPLADALINRCMAIQAIGKELNAAGSHTDNDAKRIERLYFELGSLVMANLGVISGSLYANAALRIALTQGMPDAELIEKQVKEFNDLDTTKN